MLKNVTCKLKTNNALKCSLISRIYIIQIPRRRQEFHTKSIQLAPMLRRFQHNLKKAASVLFHRTFYWKLPQNWLWFQRLGFERLKLDFLMVSGAMEVNLNSLYIRNVIWWRSLNKLRNKHAGEASLLSRGWDHIKTGGTSTRTQGKQCLEKREEDNTLAWEHTSTNNTTFTKLDKKRY